MPDWITILGIIGTILGFAYMYLEYKAHYALWPVGIVWSVCYLVIFALQGFYAWSLTWIYYLFTNIYGAILWKKKNDESRKELPITHLPKKRILPVVFSCVVLTVPIWFFVKTYNPYVSAELDAGSLLILVSEAVSTSLGIVGMLLLAKKIAEQWIIWMVVNFLYLIANIYIKNVPITLFYVVYTTISVLGWIRWNKKAVTESTLDKN